jgi:hypothetical protein
MLVYVKDSVLSTVLQEVTTEDIPNEVMETDIPVLKLDKFDALREARSGDYWTNVYMELIPQCKTQFK